jgi:uncharacterized membrane protein
LVLISAMLLFVVETQAQAQSLMTRHVRQAVISGEAWFLDRLPAAHTLRLDVVLQQRDRAKLESFLREVYDPSSPFYRHFLAAPEFTARFGPSQEDYDAVIRFAVSNGLRVVSGSRDAMDVQMEGSVTSIETAFHVSMGVYQHPTENRTFYAPDREPTVDLPFALWHISGLDNYSVPQPTYKHRNPGVKSNATTGSGPSSSFLGSDMRSAYYGGTALTGSGQNIGLLEFFGYDISDLNTYYTNAQQTRAAAVTGISTDGTSLSCLFADHCDDTEQIIDMTQALGMAPGITTLYVYVGSTDTAILGAMTTNTPLPLQLSSSWTWTPVDPSTDDPYFQKMAAQGQSFFQAAGDSGAWSPKNDLYPSEDANVICVGGTDLTTSSAGGPWSSEIVWVDGGGGISPDHIAIPSWQQLSGVINSSNQGSTSYRNGPDVSANANYSFYVCADQTTCTANEYGGTSFAAPMWAGYLALANQQSLADGNSPLGFINPAIYQIGVSSNYGADFHDITSGSNGFPAEVGYDLATGWGSPNGAGLINALTGVSPNFSISASPASVSVVPGSSGASTITTGVLNGFDGAIGLSAAGQPTGVTVTFNPTSIPAPGSGSSTMTMAVASITTPGTYTITVAGTSGSLQQSATVTLVVNDFSISGTPSSQTVTAGNGTSYTATIMALDGFSGNVALSATGLPTGAMASFNPTSVSGSGSSAVSISTLSSTPAGTYTVTITGTSGSLQNSATVTLVVNAGTTSTGGPVNLSAAYNLIGLVADGTTFASNGGVDRSGSAYSANLLGSTVSFGGASFAMGPANAPSAVSSATVTLPAGQYSTLAMLGTAVNGNQASQTFTVTYTDSTTSTFTQGLSNWNTPQNYAGESKAVTMAYRDKSNGTKDNRTFYLFGYSFALNPAKTVSSFALPSNSNIVVLAITLAGGSSSPGFSISGTPSSQTVTAGNGTSYTGTITALNGFSGNVALSATGLPTGATASFNPTSVTGSGSSAVSISTLTSTPAGMYTVTLTGTSGSLQQSATVTLNVAGFSISCTPSSQTVTAGNGTSYTAAVTALDGFSGNVALSATGLPTGATASFNPTSVTGSGSSAVSISTLSSTPAGMYTVTLTGTSGSLQQSTTVTLNVADFSISATPSSQSVTAGKGASFTAAVTALDGFSGNVALSATGLPTGATASFNPTSVSGSGSSAVSISTLSSTPAGTYTVTITGTSGSLQNSATVTLVVNAGTTSTGGPVNLSAAYNLIGLVADGTTFASNGGVDRSGSAYSANLLGSTVSFGGASFAMGPANAPSAVSSATVTLPAGQYSTLAMLGTGVNGNQASQTFTVTYTDGTTSTFTQSLSNWNTPQNYAGESKAVTMAYRDKSNGTKDNRTFYLFGYSFALNPAKTVSSITLPSNSNLVVLAITLAQ